MAAVHTVSLKTELDAREAQAKAEKLHDTIKKTKKEASGISVSGGTTAPKSALSPSANRAKESSEYGVTRTMRPDGTGASARDFAKQAEGLGGLVRLYATYAANVFAVSAAFNALQAAQDTANMVKGLNQLGAASGVALGNLSKDLVKVTDGAVSLREAMEATVKASSSGMVSKDILRMGEVAKKASQALGINMPDALSRISRGITKLEPELLDELGIFTRIDPAVQAYAKQVGKSVSSLSQFEKQMAFSNAVLEEGERKFGAINIETNAYTQLLAKLKDAATSIGDTLNVVLVPIVKLLSSSPTALYSAIAAMALMVTKQAIPAFANMRKAVLENMNALGDIAKEKQKGLTSFMADLADNAKRQAHRSMTEYDTMLEQMQDRLAVQKGKMSKAQIEFLNSGVNSPITPELIKDLDAQAARAEKRGQGNVQLYKDMANTAAIYYREEQAFQQRAQEDAAKRLSKTLEYKAAVRELQDTQNAQSKAFIINSAIEKANIEGLGAGYRRLREEIRNKREEAKTAEAAAKKGDISNIGATGFGKVAAGTTLLAGSFSLLTGVVSKGMSIVAPWLEFIALAAVGLTLLDSWLDTTAEQASKFNDAIASSKDATKTLTENIDRLSTLKASEFFNAETIKGTSTAIITVADSISMLSTRFEKLKEKQSGSWWARMKDGFASMWGGDAQTKFTEGVAESITSLLKDLDRAPAKFKATADAIAKLTGVSDPTNLVAMEKALKGMDKDSTQFKQLSAILQKLKVDAGNLATEVMAFKTSLTEFGDATKALSDQFIDKDPLTVFAQKGLASQEKLQKALKEDTVGAVTAMKDALDDLAKKPIFGSDADIAKIGKMKMELEGMQKALLDNEKELTELTKERAKVQAEYAANYIEAGEKIRKLGRLDETISTKKNEINSAKARAPQLIAEVDAMSKKGAEGFLNILDAKIAATMTKGGTAFMGTVLSTIGNLPGVAKMEANLQLGEISFQQKMLEIQAKQLEHQAIAAINTGIIAEYTKLQFIKQVSDPNNATGAADMQAAKIRGMETDRDKISSTKDPRQILAMSRDKTGETSKALADYALAVTGLQQQLRNLGDQAAAIKFTEAVKTIQASYEVQKKVKQELIEQYNTSLHTLDVQDKKVEILSTESILSREKLSNSKAEEETALTILGIEERKAVLEKAKVAASGKVGSSEVINSANEEIKLLDKQKASKEANLNITKEENALATKSVIWQNAQKRAAVAARVYAQERAILDLENEAQASARNNSAEMLSIYGIDTTNLQLINTLLAQEYTTKQAIAALDSQKNTEISNIPLNSADPGGEKARIEEKYRLMAAGEASTLASLKEKTAAQIAFNALQQEQIDRTDIIARATESLTSVFGDLGSAIGGVVSALNNVATVQETNAVKIKAQQQGLNKLLLDENVSIDAKAEGIKKHEKLVAKQAEAEEDANLSVLTSSKKLFGEKTAAYKILDTMEKLAHIRKIALAAKEFAVKMGWMTAEVAGKTATVGANLALETTQSASTVALSIPAMIAKMYAQLGIFGPIGIGLALAAIAGAGGSTGGVQIPGAAEIQETQGTGSVLGDEKAKNRDIEVGIESLNKLTLFGLNTSQNMLSELEKIAYNTSNLGNTLLRIPGLFGGKSTFGTKEKSNPGFLGLFASSTSIIDSGIKFAQGMFQQYETVQKTRSGFLGIGRKTKTYQNMKPLEQEAQDQLNKLYKQYLGVAGQAIEDLGFGAKNLNVQLIESAVDMEKFNVSLKGMQAEEAQAAIQGVFGNVISDALKSTYPFLAKYQNAGEGLLATAIRVSQEMNYVGKAMTLTGMKFKYAAVQASTLTEAGVAKAKAARAALAAAKAEEAAALAHLNERKAYRGYMDYQSGPDTEDVTAAEERYAAAKTASQLAQEAATASLGQSQTANIEANIALSQALIDGAGGIEAFTEQIDFYTENFMTQSERAVGMYSVYSDQLTQTNTKFKDLGLSASMTRQEFSNLVQAQDLNTEAGRKQWQALMDLAPAFDAAKDAMADFLDSVGIGTSVWDDMLTSIMDGDMEDIGSSVAETVKDGFYAAMGENFKSQIIAIVMEQLITPVITSVITGSVTGALLTQTAMDAIVAKIVATAQAYAAVLNDPAFQQAIAGISTTIATAFQGIDGILGGINKTSFVFQNLGLDDLNKDLIKAYKDQRTEIKKTRDALASTIDKFKSFAQSLKEFKASLLLGAESPLTPAQRYAEAKRQFDDISSKAAAGDQTAMGQVQSAAKALLDASRGMYASGSQYTSDFNMVQSILDSLISQAEGQISIDEQQLASLDAQITQLDSQIALLEAANDTNKSIEQILIEIRDKESKATQLGVDQTVKGFHMLDRNLDGLLTLDELKASGMASDKDIQRLHAMMDANGDGQISRLEAIAAASEGTTFSLQSIDFLMKGVKSGTITMSAALEQIAQILSANGGSGTGSNLGKTGYRSSLGGLILEDTIVAKDGTTSMNREEGRVFTMQYLQGVDAGTPDLSADKIYHLLKEVWGLDSNAVAKMLGWTQEGVLGWFWSHNPNLPAFAQGTNYVPEDMTAQIHKGERIIPAADNTRLMAAIENKELLKEVQKLNAKIESLEQTVAQGAVLNANATDRNTDEISRTVKDAGSIASHTEAIRRKVSIK